LQPQTANQVSARAARRIIHDGPFAQTTEALAGGFFPPLPGPVSTFLSAWGIHEHQQMTMRDSYSIRPIGFIRSEIKHRSDAPRQGREGAPNALLEIIPAFRQGLERMRVGAEIIVITWLHRAQRNVLKVRPRGEPPLTGVFSTRSPDRPNPVGLHRVKVLKKRAGKLLIGPIEAIDGTPVIDIKPVIESKDY
jgi:tRNA-Thr(GGU) m(6)t(6)A37 methyltransferase TsaA